MQKDFGYSSVIETLSLWDRNSFLFLNSFHAEWLNPVMQMLSGQGIWIPLILIFIWHAKNQFNTKALGLFVLFLSLAIIASDVTSSYIIKNIVQRLRPCRVEDLLPLIYQFKQKCGGRFGFVSSHSANSFCILVFSFFTLKLKALKFQFLWAIPVLVGFSRIYLGVHYPGDLLGGFLVGGMWGIMLAYTFKNSKLRSQSV